MELNDYDFYVIRNSIRFIEKFEILNNLNNSISKELKMVLRKLSNN